MDAKLAYEFFEKAFYNVVEQKIKLYPINYFGEHLINGFSVKEEEDSIVCALYLTDDKSNITQEIVWRFSKDK
jgi:hypothetical protein